MRRTGPLVEALADDCAVSIQNDSAHAWVRVGKGSTSGKLEGTTHERNIEGMPLPVLRGVHLALCHVLPLVLDSCFGRAPGRKRSPTDPLRPEGQKKQASLLLPLIRTFTVGPGVSPGSPAAGYGRVADFNRRFGITPITEHVQPVCHRDARTRHTTVARPAQRKDPCPRDRFYSSSSTVRRPSSVRAAPRLMMEVSVATPTTSTPSAMR